MADIPDFSMKQHIDPTAIAALLQRKAIAEEEAKARRRLQNLQTVELAVNSAAAGVSAMVQRSKEKQKMDFVRSLSDAMAASVPLQTTTFAEPKQISSMVPPVQSIATPDVEKQNLMRSATMVDPEAAAAHAFRTANPASDPINNKLSFQRMTFTDSNGKEKTVNVGVRGTQLVNPVTLQPFTGSPKEVDEMPEYGFVEREEYAGTDNEGNPVYRNPVAQTQYTRTQDGKVQPHTGPILPKLQNPGEGMSDKVAFISETRMNLKDAIDKFEPEFVGPVAGRIGSLRKYFDSLTDEKQEEFRNFIDEIDVIRRNKLFGSALTESEQKFFREVSLDKNISPKAFLARLKSAERKLSNKEKALMRSAKISGKVFRQDDEEPEATSGRSAEDEANDFLNSFLGGQ